MFGTVRGESRWTKRPKRSITKPKAIRVRLVRFHASSVRSAAKNTRGSLRSDIDLASTSMTARGDGVVSGVGERPSYRQTKIRWWKMQAAPEILYAVFIDHRDERVEVRR